MEYEGEAFSMFGASQRSGEYLPGVILLGAQRSGTTPVARMLSNAFAAQGGLFVVNAKLAYYLLRWLTPDDVAARHLRDDELIYALSRRPPKGPGADVWMERSHQAIRRAARHVASGASVDAGTLARDVVAEVYRGFRLWGEKYNETICNLDGYSGLVPDARYLVLIRHPLQQAATIVRWQRDSGWRPTGIGEALEKWRVWHLLLLNFLRKLPRHRFQVILYNELVDPAIQSSLAEFSGIEMPAEFGTFENHDTLTVALGRDDEGKLATALDLWMTCVDLAKSVQVGRADMPA